MARAAMIATSLPLVSQSYKKTSPKRVEGLEDWPKL